jgi:hypothetical protein
LQRKLEVMAKKVGLRCKQKVVVMWDPKSAIKLVRETKV